MSSHPIMYVSRLFKILTRICEPSTSYTNQSTYAFSFTFFKRPSVFAAIHFEITDALFCPRRIRITFFVTLAVFPYHITPDSIFNWLSSSSKVSLIRTSARYWFSSVVLSKILLASFSIMTDCNKKSSICFNCCSKLLL